MATPSSPVSDRLRALDPEALGRSVGEALLEHVARLIVPCAPGLTLRAAGDPAACGLALTAADLCRYAQTGALGDWEGAADALDAAQSVVEGVYSAPADRLLVRVEADAEGDRPPPWTAAIDLRTDLGLVLGSALVRAWAATGASRVPAAWIGALLGVTDGRVRQWVTDGPLRAETVSDGTHRRSLVEPESVRQLLATRGL